MIEVIKEKGLEVESGPFQPNPHIKFFHVKDPNGVSIQLVENSTSIKGYANHCSPE
jgi:lactoylglutathione lyase